MEQQSHPLPDLQAEIRRNVEAAADAIGANDRVSALLTLRALLEVADHTADTCAICRAAGGVGLAPDAGGVSRARRCAGS